MNFQTAMDNLKLKFTSSNSILVDRATILSEEFEAVVKHIDMLENYQKHAQDDLTFYQKRIAELEEVASSYLNDLESAIASAGIHLSFADMPERQEILIHKARLEVKVRKAKELIK
ncbi:MAG: hypothetical protein QM500_18180 [Methylococcales bacterium]